MIGKCLGQKRPISRASEIYRDTWRAMSRHTGNQDPSKTPQSQLLWALQGFSEPKT
jgi:hypothetical protein